MSIASGTTHYGYPQVQLNDRPTFADFNPAFEDIDSKLYGLITGASTDHSAIESLQTRLGETNLLLASVKQTADNASGKADTNAEAITLLQTGLGQTQRDVANKLDSVAIAEPYDAAAGTYSVGDIVAYNGQRYKCTTAVAVAEPFDADKWTGEDVQTVLEHLQDEIDDIPTGGAAADVTLAPITGMTATDVQAGIEELKSNLGNKVDYLSNSNYTELNTSVPYNSSYTAPVTATYLINIGGDLSGSPKLYLDSGRTIEIADYYADSNTYHTSIKIPLKQGTTIYTRNSSTTTYTVKGYYAG